MSFNFKELAFELNASGGYNFNQEVILKVAADEGLTTDRIALQYFEDPINLLTFLVPLYQKYIAEGGEHNEAFLQIMAHYNLPEHADNNYSIQKWPLLPVVPPSAEEIRALRQLVGSTRYCASLIGLGKRTMWEEYEKGTKKPSAQSWGLFLLAIGKHPKYEVLPRL